jgi:hypothetical protein
MQSDPSSPAPCPSEAAAPLRMGRRTLLLGATALTSCAGSPQVASLANAATVPGIRATAPDPGNPPANVVLPLPVPCATQPGDIVGLLLEGAGSPAGTVMVFGHAFRPGDLPQGAGLSARLADTGRAARAQVDVTTRHADGSARFAVVAVEVPVALPVGDRAGLVLAAAPGVASEAAIDPAVALAGREAMVEITPAAGGAPWRFDLLAMRPTASGAGARNGFGGGGPPWQWGPLALQWRVATPVPPSAIGGATSMRLLADLAVHADGTLRVDAWFRNDIAQRPGGGPARYSARVLIDGVEALAFAPPGAHHQYTAIGRQLAAIPGGRPAPPSPFLRPDAQYLAAAGTVQPLDLTTGVNRRFLANMAQLRAGPDWNRPFDRRGIVAFMPQGGGRPDIGPMTDWQAAWLMSGEPQAGSFVIGQAEAAGGIPWHFWDVEGAPDRRGGWLSVKRWPGLWTDPRGGPPPGGLAQPMPTDTGWTPDLAHPPDIAYLPYVLTGRRALLDEVLALASWSIIGRWPFERTPPDWRGRAGADMILGNDSQVRVSAWSLRNIDGAAWIMPDNDPDAPMLREAVTANWAWLRSKIPAWTAWQGEAHGWLPGDFGNGLLLSPWQQDYVASTVAQAARRGNGNARAFLGWMANFLVGRFMAEDKGLAFTDGAAYLLAIRTQPGRGDPLRSWAEIARTMRERNLSAPTGWVDGNYAALALMSVAQVADVLDLPEAWQVYARVVAARPPHASPEALSMMPSLNIVPRGTQRFPDRLRACTAAAPAQR